MVCIKIGEIIMKDVIKILQITDNEDGSSLVQLEMDPNTYAKIFEYGFVELIKEGLKETKNE
tara:strand:- start:531 stop:716 length:186 start_codon:yes stop_codon:yes gene_type:complete